MRKREVFGALRGVPDRELRCWLQAPEETARREAYEEAAMATVADVVG